MIDDTITLGNIITLVGFLVSSVATIAVLRNDIGDIKRRVTNLEDNGSKITDALTVMAVQSERMNSQGYRISELERINRDK